MSDDRVVRSGPFKGKKIQMASTAGVDLVREVAEDFMREIFEMEQETLDAIRARVRRVYGLDVSGIPHGNLLGIFKRIRGFQ